MSGDKFIFKNIQKNAEKGAPHLLMTEEQKYYVLEIKESHGQASETIKSKLADVRLKGRILRIELYPNLKQHLMVLQWAMEHINWANYYWLLVIWSDETKISLFSSDSLKYVRRRIAEMLRPDCIQATVYYPHSFIT
ncbi:transposable element Tcb1 transposase [Trichonephila clavipes]|nr:transposable element Tcb1 transposase [Trichonephila clavipes]